MKKKVAGIVMIDICPQCRGTWFDEGELAIIQDHWSDEGLEQGLFPRLAQRAGLEIGNC